jgi:transposase
MRERLTLTTRDQQRLEVLTRWIAGILTTDEAVGLLGLSERSAWRLRRRLIERGADGLVHGNRGRASPVCLSADTKERIVALAGPGGLYEGINDCHLAELLAEEKDIWIGRSSLQRLLRVSGFASPRTRRRSRYRSRRERMAQAGLLVQLDGSPHDWLGDRGPRLTLVGGIDDASGVIVGATFRENEDGAGYFEVLRQMCSRHGVPCAVYRDRSGIFSPTLISASIREQASQVGRAFAELGITSIPASSPQAKGRVERLWGTCQDRLVTMLRLAGADDMASANAVLASFIPKFNRRFAVPTAISTPAWRPVPAGMDLGHVCAFRWHRTVGNDNTVRHEGAVLQLPPARGGRGLAGRRVELELRLDGRLLVQHEGRTLLAVAAPPDPERLRDICVLAEGGPKAASGRDRPGYAPAVEHPWRRSYRTMPDRKPLTESLSR